MSNQRQIILAVICFAMDNHQQFPETVATIGSGNEWNWQEPTMLTGLGYRTGQTFRSLSGYLRGYIPDVKVMFCPNAPREYKYLQEAWDAGDRWDNPQTPQPQDPLIGTYCFYWNYIGILEDESRLFEGPRGLAESASHSTLLVSDFLAYGHWRSPNSYISCELSPRAGIAKGTWVSSDLWSYLTDELQAKHSKPQITLFAGYTDGHVEGYNASETVGMKVSMTADGWTAYPSILGPGTIYLPSKAVR